MKKTIIYIISILFIFSCKKDGTVSSTPTIKLLSVSSTSLLQFKDSLVINIEYTDGDGDIGEIEPDKNAIQIKDKRLTKADYYFIKPQSPPGSKIITKGTININIKNLFLLGSSNSEITSLEIKLKDRSGNWSNAVNTPNITITK